MVAERLEVRLSEEHRRKLAELADRREMSISDAVRGLIDLAYEEVDREKRMKAARALGKLNIPVPEPEELKRLLNDAHDPRVD